MVCKTVLHRDDTKMLAQNMPKTLSLHLLIKACRCIMNAPSYSAYILFLECNGLVLLQQYLKVIHAVLQLISKPTLYQ